MAVIELTQLSIPPQNLKETKTENPKEKAT